VTSTIRKETRA